MIWPIFETYVLFEQTTGECVDILSDAGVGGGNIERVMAGNVFNGADGNHDFDVEDEAVKKLVVVVESVDRNDGLINVAMD